MYIGEIYTPQLSVYILHFAYCGSSTVHTTLKRCFMAVLDVHGKGAACRRQGVADVLSPTDSVIHSTSISGTTDQRTLTMLYNPGVYFKH